MKGDIDMRKLKRSIARFMMQSQGIERLNKKLPIYDRMGRVIGHTSFFAEHWREYFEQGILPRKQRRPRRPKGQRIGFMERARAAKA